MAYTPVLEEVPTPVLEEVRTLVLEEVRTPVLEEVRTPALEEVRTLALEEVRTPALEEVRTLAPEAVLIRGLVVVVIVVLEEGGQTSGTDQILTVNEIYLSYRRFSTTGNSPQSVVNPDDSRSCFMLQARYLSAVPALARCRVPRP